MVVYWAEQGVRIFRVDNPHTKPFHFWEWLIAEVKKDYPDAIFLAEAFTRPKVMYRLAKLGFTQSYTYFTWRNTKWELTEYLTELTQTAVQRLFPAQLLAQHPGYPPRVPAERRQAGLHGAPGAGGHALLQLRHLRAGLRAVENVPREPGSEEYLNSEKYEIKHWDIDRPDSLKDFIARVNRIRRENPALQRNRNLWFNAANNDQLICYSKHTDDLTNIILVVVNLDPRHAVRDGKCAAAGLGLRRRAVLPGP